MENDVKLIDTAKKELRYAGEPDFSTLNECQMQAMEQMQAFSQSESTMFLLQGYAGSGKTFIISKFIEWYLSVFKSHRVAMTAPTNKAVRVLYKSADYKHSSLSYKTCHKLLGLKEQIDDDGKQIFVVDSMIVPDIDLYKFLVVDEASMLGDELFELFLFHANLKGLKILFVGDSNQIPPIGKNLALPFDLETQESYSIASSTLSTIVRQAEGNPIIEVATSVRTRLTKHTAILTRENKVTDNSSVLFLDTWEKADKAKLIELINEWFTGWQFEADSDYCKIVAWRNKTVDSYNTYIRKLLFGENIPKISIGEKLFANTPIVEEEEVLFTTNEEFEVTSYSIEDFVINNGDYVLKYYKTNVKCERAGEYVLETIKILHEDSQATFTKILDYLTQTAKSLKRGSTQARETWKQFYALKNIFADIKYNYTISAHKSQASTYTNCIVIESDLDANRKVVERNKIKYTAVTRPKNNLVIVRTEAK